MKVTVTSTGLDDLESLLRDAAEDVVPEAEKVVSKGALNIKNDARRRVSGRAHLPHYPSAISYDMETTGTLVHAEVGPVPERRQGRLDNILEFGSPGRPPIPHLMPSADAEEPRFVAAVEQLGVDLLEGRR